LYNNFFPAYDFFGAVCCVTHLCFLFSWHLLTQSVKVKKLLRLLYRLWYYQDNTGVIPIRNVRWSKKQMLLPNAEAYSAIQVSPRRAGILMTQQKLNSSNEAKYLTGKPFLCPYKVCFFILQILIHFLKYMYFKNPLKYAVNQYMAVI